MCLGSSHPAIRDRNEERWLTQPSASSIAWRNNGFCSAAQCLKPIVTIRIEINSNQLLLETDSHHGFYHQFIFVFQLLR